MTRKYFKSENFNGHKDFYSTKDDMYNITFTNWNEDSDSLFAFEISEKEAERLMQLKHYTGEALILNCED